MRPPASRPIRLALPKGSMRSAVEVLLADAGVSLRATARGYRPTVGLDGYEAKLLKPQSILEMLAAGSRDVGFAGSDWVSELDVDVVEVLDTGLDPVRLVAAAPATLLQGGRLPQGTPLRVASEYARLAQKWMADQGIVGPFIRSWGATEVYPPEDADLIVDNTASGATLAANGLVILDELLTSTTRLYASRAAWEDPTRRKAIEDFALLVGSVLEARRRVLMEVNVGPERLDDVLGLLPAMREPTVSALARGTGFAVKVAVLRAELPALIPAVRAAGGSDIVVSRPSQIVA
ncbi:MAG: ATP phosphoribosyltransferase [Proteobacteria bacterium]|nr:ATP phosphoribosyltransferase [Pseudomonadota bacterium]